MTIKEAAQRLGIAPQTVYQLVAARVIPARRLGLRGGRIVLDPGDVEDYWESCKVGVKPPAAGAAACRHIRPPGVRRDGAGRTRQPS